MENTDKKTDLKKRREQRAMSILTNGMSTDAPEVSPINYKIDLINALHWYGVNVPTKEKKTKVIEKFPEYSSAIKKIPDAYFSTYGSVLMLDERGMVAQDDLEKTNNKLKELIGNFHTSDEVSETKTPKKESETKKINYEHLEYVTKCVGEFLTVGKIPDFKKYFLENRLSKTEYNLIKSDFSRDYEDAMLAYEGDGFMFEAIGLSRPQLKKYIGIFESLFSITSEKKPRKTKPKTNKQLTKGIKVAPEFEGTKTLSPEKIIGAKEMWVYNFKYRKMMVYRALDGGLGVTGASITNYNDETSESKTIRKQETWNELKNVTSSVLKKEFVKIRAVPMKVKPRLGQDTIIFKIL